MPFTSRTTPNRLADRVTHERALVHQILDEALVSHLAYTVDGEPRVLPTLHVRLDDTLYLHGSTGSRPLLTARGEEGMAVCVAVTLIDGLVLARSQFHHSANYRSAVIYGQARLVTDEPVKRQVLAALVDHIVPGRAADSRPPNPRELAQTAVLAVPLAESTAKVRTGAPDDETDDLALRHWSGVLPLRLAAGAPVTGDQGVPVALPPYLHGYCRDTAPQR
ncbi:MAG: pyridoxamine 5'-phosphate oxidase family protein [Micromonosporaceae bacterium]